MQEQEKLYIKVLKANENIKEAKANFDIAILRLSITLFINFYIQVHTLFDAYDTPFWDRPWQFIIFSCAVQGIICYLTIPVNLYMKQEKPNGLGAIVIFLLLVNPFGLILGALLSLPLGATYLVHDILKIFEYRSENKTLLKMKEQYAQSILDIEYE